MKIFCIGRNYKAHAEELNNPLPDQPLIFCKPQSSILKTNKPFFYPNFSKDIQHELELVVRICKNGKHIEEDFAHRYYKDFCLGIDFTARDIQTRLKEKGHPWEIAKGFDRSALISKFLPKTDYSIEKLNFSLNKNGEQVQVGNTQDMIFSIDFIIGYLSKYFTLQIGDLVYTGTPAGVGSVMVGDHLEGFVENKKVFHCDIR